MKTVLLLGGPAAGQRVEVHGAMTSYRALTGACGFPVETIYRITPMCSHGEVHWFGVLDGADPLALLIDGYTAKRQELVQEVREFIAAPPRPDIVWAPKPAATGVGLRPPSPYGTGGVKEGDDR